MEDWSPEKWFTEKAFLWNRWCPTFPPFFVFDKLYVLEKIFPRFDHCFNGNKFLGYIARYSRKT